MTLNPHVQRRAQAEVDSALDAQESSPDRLPILEDRVRMPYVSALIKEVYRWNPVVPLSKDL
jgi:cytochrome P450